MKFCAVVGCSHRSTRDKEIKYFRFPSAQNRQRQIEPARVERRSRWIAALHRSDFPETKIKNSFICSSHFVTGQPSGELDHPDYVPSQNMGHTTTSGELEISSHSWTVNWKIVLKEVPAVTIPDSGMEKNPEEVSENIDESTHDKSTQTDLDLRGLEEDYLTINRKFIEYKDLVDNLSFNEGKLVDNNNKTLFLTGITTYKQLKLIYSLLEPFITIHLNRLNKFQHLLLTLMRLRLNVSFKLLSCIFSCSEQTVSRIFFNMIDILFYRLRHFIIWPSREELHRTMPACFRTSFGNKVTVIIDCFEIFIEKPSNLDAQASTWSNYKHHNTVKYLIGITPYGAISFISDGYGGRISDKLLTKECGILENLLPGDLVLADRGFLIEDLVGLHCASVKTPSFLKGQKQLEPHELEETRNISNVRIHVERVIGVLRQKYTILHETLPITMAKRKGDDDMPMLDKILTVCCALVNMCPSIVPLD